MTGVQTCALPIYEDLGESSEGLIVFSQTARPTGGRRNDGNLSRALLDTAHRYLSIYIYIKPKLLELP